MCALIVILVVSNWGWFTGTSQ